MDNGTVVQIIAGILFVVGLVFLIQRRRRRIS
jgi:LPXTG-motif cell wall-anchored protein